jgi:transcriptional regulator with XRE-family HTH domain
MKTIQENKNFNFSQNLIRLRKIQHISQKKLSELSGISQRMINYYEKHAINPPLDKIEAIAKALNVSVNDLIETKNFLDSSNTMPQELLKLDTKTLEKIKIILSLPKQQRHIVYSIAEALLHQYQDS